MTGKMTDNQETGSTLPFFPFLRGTLKSLSPLFFSIFDEKLSHPWIQIQKKQMKFLRLSMGFDRKKIKI